MIAITEISDRDARNGRSPCREIGDRHAPKRAIAIERNTHLNAAPPEAAIFVRVAERLREHAQLPLEPGTEIAVQHGLATVARLLGRSWDATAEQAYRRVVFLRPERWQDHYGIGLFFKTRGRFGEGLAANLRASELGGAEVESVRWNLGICATGAGNAEAALTVWKALGQKIEFGRFGLPDGRYHSVKVRLAERPLAERDVARMPDYPGLEETVWVERLSPCHGIVRSALYQELGVDYGDVVLFDGAPITHHKYGDEQVPVFPHLATLVRPRYRILAFAGTQSREGEIAELSSALPGDAVVYSHSEQLTIMCSSCWADAARDHSAHTGREHHVVVGKVCAPLSIEPSELLRLLDAAVAARPAVQLYVPALSAEVGPPERASVDARRYAMIAASQHEE